MVPERTPARANPARGIALIATAVIVGIFLLRNGWDDGGSVAADGADDAAEVTGGDPASGGDDEETTSSTQPVRPPAEVTVRVANASGVSGAGAALTEQIAEGGWQTVEATNAPPGTDPARSIVLFAPGFENEAAALVTAIGAAPGSVGAFSDPPQVDPGGAQLIVILGTDLAG